MRLQKYLLLLSTLCFYYFAPGNFAIMVQFTDYCGNSAISEKQGTAVDDGCSGSNTTTSAHYNLSIFPNTAHNNLIITIPKNIDVRQTIIKFYDMYGRIVKQITNTKNYNDISISNFKSGVYLVKIFDGNKEIMTKKIIKN
ncbi:MAG: T9SS type A sorting domain-containing protein [Bacteroidota bacterium]|nr:T9SS type A sorting domain-containing protein [Bacteroidota bacterium]